MAGLSISASMLLRTLVVCASSFLTATTPDVRAATLETGPATTSATEQGLEISNKHPVLRIPVKPALLTNLPNVLVLSITNVSNPTLQPVTMNVYFETPARKSKEGTFTLFPADRPGTFKLRINQKAVNELRQAAEKDIHSAALSVEMVSEGKGPHSDEASVVVRMKTPEFIKLDR
jgi:hypothetical protein